jgi:hypothetical protein
MQSPAGYVKLPRINSQKNILFWLLNYLYFSKIISKPITLNQNSKNYLFISDLFSFSNFLKLENGGIDDDML